MSYGGWSVDELREKLKELRRKRGWSQEDLAREIGVSMTTVQRWEARGGKPYRLARQELQRLFHGAGIGNEG
jgi:putative transcriptional regulator